MAETVRTRNRMATAGHRRTGQVPGNATHVPCLHRPGVRTGVSPRATQEGLEPLKTPASNLGILPVTGSFRPAFGLEIPIFMPKTAPKTLEVVFFTQP